MTKKRQSQPLTSKPRQLRIIAGKWRGRKISFTEVDGLRPTADRIRETLFNWLGQSILDSRCLDLFAGSGALSLEALSRGASHVDLIELNPQAVNQLNKQIQTLDAYNATVHKTSALFWLDNLKSSHPPYDLVFLDPPFHKNLASQCLEKLHNSSVLAPKALIYVETALDESLPVLPQGWNIHKDKQAGQVRYRLIAT